MQQKRFLAVSQHGFHRVAYTEWGDAANPRVLLCVHGLTRNGRDFDVLARAMADHYRVVCPDMIGRGRSDWLAFKADYGYPLYVGHMAALIAHLGVEQVDWVGTSMGALTGMMIAAMPGSPIRRMVMNDAGALIPKAALERIAQYVGRNPAFDTIEQAEAYIRDVSAPFGPLTDAQWRQLTVHMVNQDSDGKLRLTYDPAIGDAFRQPLNDVDLSAMWQMVRCPVLITRGKESDLLLAQTAAKMLQRPGTELVEFDGIGHAPMFLDAAQIAPVRAFLLAG